jgi:hypothetical protein
VFRGICGNGVAAGGTFAAVVIVVDAVAGGCGALEATDAGRGGTTGVFTIAAAAPAPVSVAVADAIPATDAETGSLIGVGEGAADSGVLAVETGELGSEASAMVMSGSAAEVAASAASVVGGSGPGPPPTWGGPFMSTSSSDESSSASLSGRTFSFSSSFLNVDRAAAAEPPS